MQIFTDLANIDFEKLESFVYQDPRGNFFQSNKAYEFFKSVNNFEPILIVARDGEEIVGSLLAVLIKEKGLKSYFSRRCIVWGGPLVKDDKPDILAMSALLTTTSAEQKNVIEGLKKAGLRDKVKIIVGGSPINQEFADSIGADGYGATAPEGVRLVKKFLSVS